MWFIPQNLCFIPRTSHGYLFDDTRYWVLEADWTLNTAFSDWLIEFRIKTPGTLISQCFDWLHSLNSIYNWFKHRITFLNRWLPIVDRSAFRPHPPIGSYSADKRVDWWYYLPQYIIGAGLLGQRVLWFAPIKLLNLWIRHSKPIKSSISFILK